MEEELKGLANNQADYAAETKTLTENDKDERKKEKRKK